MTQFPMSAKLQAVLVNNHAVTSHYALRLACQEHFEKWLKAEDHSQRSNYLGFRCLLEALENVASVKKVRRRAMRKTQMDTFEDFLGHVMDRFEFVAAAAEAAAADGSEADIRGQVHKLYMKHQPDFGTLELVVGLQAFLQELLEYLVLFDRIFYLSENGLCSEMVRLFDPLVSPRCYALLCQKTETKVDSDF